MRRKVGDAYTQALHPLSLSVKRSLKPLSSADATLPHEDEISELDWVEVETPDGVTEYYRVSEIETNTADGKQRVSLQHGAVTLRDKLIGEEHKKSDTIANHLAYILGKQSVWSIGTVEATATVYMSLRNDTLMSAIETLMETIPTYQAVFAQNGPTNWTVSILERPEIPACEARLSRNLTDCRITYETSKLCTRVISDTLTGGKLDSDNIAVYGVHEEAVSISKDLTAAQRTAMAQSYLDAHDHPEISVEISGVELSRITGLSLDRFTLGSVCRVAIPWLNVTADEVIIEKSYGDVLAAPEKVKLTLANSIPDLSLMAANTRHGGRRTAQAVEDAERQLVVHQTDISRNNDRILLWASASEWDEIAEQYQLMGKSQMALTWDQIQSTVQQTGAFPGVNTFDPTASYAVNDKVIWKGVVYKFTAAHQAGAWIGTDAERVPTSQSQITQSANSISQIVTAVGEDGEVTAASITLAINDGASGAYINADKVMLSATDPLSGYVSVDSNLLYVSGQIIARKNGTYQTITGGDLVVTSGGSLTFNGAQAGQRAVLNITNLSNILNGQYISAASVSGDTLTLTRSNGTTINFNKAGGGDPDDIRLGSFTWRDSNSGWSPVGANEVTSIKTLYEQHKNDHGYITWNATIQGVSGARVYYMTIGSAT